MSHTFEELKGKTVAQLREIAAGIEHEAVQGHTQLNKDHLLAGICTALGIDMHVHHEIKGINKSSIKSQIKELKKERDQAIDAKDYDKLKSTRLKIRALKKKLRKAMD